MLGASDSPSPPTEDERRRALEGNDTATAYPRDRCVHELFAERAEESPDAVAVVFGDEELTYGQLDRRANRLAHLLRRHGIGPEVPVGICVERSLELPVGLLGILKAGGAYLPLDPAYPAERLSLMIRDARPPVLLTQSRLVEKLPHESARVIPFDAEEGAAAGEPDGPLDGGVGPESLAYVVYTSGSTGVPKGVCVEHRSVVRLVRGADYLTFAPDDVFLGLASIAFDASTLEIWGPLLGGGRLALAPPGRLGVAELVDAVRRHGVTTLWLTAGLFHQVIDADPSGLDGVRNLLAGGDVLSPARVRAALRHLPRTRLVNGYGPTENTTFTCCFAMSASAPPPAGPVPIGRPIANTRAYVLDEHRRPVADGVAGELYAAGDGLARGYLRDPALTAERFVPDPFVGEPGARMYRTGDLARRRPDGNLDFLGRVDGQVKVRGFRVEPGEVEAALTEHPGVRDSVVVAHEDEPGEKRLVAYVVAEPGSERSSAVELRRALERRLPEHLVPSSFVAVDVLPLTAQGKVDRRALPPPGRERPALDTPWVAPRSAPERFVASRWRDLLDLDRVGADDDFFELGGDSIRAIVFLNQLAKAMGEPVPMATVFEAPTIAGLVRHLERHHADALERLGSGEAGEDSPGVRGEGAASPSASTRSRRAPASPEGAGAASPPNPPAIVILAPPRSGSTLLRVMLGGHPLLFAPPELELLSFATLAERRASLAPRHGLWLEGTVRALMALGSRDAGEARREMEEWEREGLTTAECYGRIQARLGERRLVDKTTSYPLRPEALRRAEATFDGALYVHLTRDPWATVRSFEAAGLERLFVEEGLLSGRELAESIWSTGHRNVLEFLEHVPARRRHRLRYEDLVADPRTAMEELCGFVGLSFHPEMLRPHADRDTRMTDGVDPGSAMVGDPGWGRHEAIDPRVAGRWASEDAGELLGEVTWALAESLGYERPDPRGERALPLSPGQRRLWKADRMQPGIVFPGTPAFRLRGPLDRAALGAALTELCARHEAVRTTYHAREGGKPVQIVRPPRPLRPTEVDLRDRPAGEREPEARALLEREAERPFDLAEESMLRAVLVRVDDEEHLLMVVVHHVAFDAWSLDLILLRELAVLYAAFRDGRPPGLPVLRERAAVLMAARRDRLSDADLNASREYWRRRLADPPASLDIPPDHDDAPTRIQRGAWADRAVPDDLVRDLRASCRRNGVTLFSTIISAWGALLGRWSGQDDLLLLTPFADRDRPELEGLVGFFANTVVVRHDLSDDPPFSVLARRTRATVLDAVSHGQMPFEELLAQLVRTGLPGALFSQPPRAVHRFDGLEVERIEVDHGGLTVPLALFAIEGESGAPASSLRVRLNYDRERFEAATAARLLDDLGAILASVVEDPGRRVSELPVAGRSPAGVDEAL